MTLFTRNLSRFFTVKALEKPQNGHVKTSRAVMAPNGFHFKILIANSTELYKYFLFYSIQFLISSLSTCTLSSKNLRPKTSPHDSFSSLPFPSCNPLWITSKWELDRAILPS